MWRKEGSRRAPLVVVLLTLSLMVVDSARDFAVGGVFDSETPCKKSIKSFAEQRLTDPPPMSLAQSDLTYFLHVPRTGGNNPRVACV
jgi:hypothetical protein